MLLEAYGQRYNAERPHSSLRHGSLAEIGQRRAPITPLLTPGRYGELALAVT